MKVTHKTFGTGTILNQNAKHQIVDVDFNGVTKKILLKVHQLLNEDGSVFKIKIEKKKTEKVVEAKSTLGTPDHEILFRLGVVDAKGIYVDSDMDTFINSQIEERNDIKKFGI